jgi:hypothetical protein
MKSCLNCSHCLVCFVAKTFVEIIETTLELFEGTDAVPHTLEGLAQDCKNYKGKDETC